MKRIILVSGTSNCKLSSDISDILDVPLVDPKVSRFANGEVFCEIEKNVRGADVFVLQSTSPPVNDNLMELLVMIDALKRASASSITAVMPHYGYSRQDRKASPRTPITAKLVANLLTVAGATRVITMDLHAGQIQGFFNILFDNVYASPVLLSYIRNNIFKKETVFVSPDVGGVERVRYYAKRLKSDLAMIDKRRSGHNVVKAMNIIGDVEGKHCVIVDDMVDTGGTLIEACKALKENGALSVVACATHPIFSSPALDRIENSDALDEIIVTNTIALSERAQGMAKIKCISIAEILAKAIHRTFNDDSVSSLFL